MTVTDAPTSPDTQMGRPVDHATTIEGLDGGRGEKDRLRVIVDHMTGAITAEEAAARLGLSRSRFFDLRKQALQGALQGLAPGVAGRPVRSEPAPDPEVVALREELEETRTDLEVSRVQTLLALTHPDLLDRQVVEGEAKKKPPTTRGLTRTGTTRAERRRARRQLQRER
jgi:hypothetical protein